MKQILLYNDAIPGFTTISELEQIALWAKNVPKNGIVIELGSFKGRSSVCLAMNCDPSVTIYCVDRFRVKYEHLFKENTSKYPNIVPIKGTSPYIKYLGGPVDLFFMDANHTNPGFMLNLNFYKQFMKPNGMMCGHDYHTSWPDVIAGVELFSKEQNMMLTLYKNTSLWSIGN